jgi:CRP-like cAMP-binding protein
MELCMCVVGCRRYPHLQGSLGHLIRTASMRQVYAEAIEDSLICVLSRTDIEWLVRTQPQVALRIIEVLGQRLTYYEAHLEEVAYRCVPARIAEVLVRLSQEQQGEVVTITHQELGDMIGAIRVKSRLRTVRSTKIATNISICCQV